MKEYYVTLVETKHFYITAENEVHAGALLGRHVVIGDPAVRHIKEEDNTDISVREVN